MQLICDVVAVLGSRHGVVFRPGERHCRILRWDPWYMEWPKCGIRAGLRLGEEEIVFPLTPRGKLFELVDQRLETCQTRWIGLHAASATRVCLQATTPFRPRDARFSTVPVIGFRLEVSALQGVFEQIPKTLDLRTVVLFLEWESLDESVRLEADGESWCLHFSSLACYPRPGDNRRQVRERRLLPQTDRLITTNGEITNRGFRRMVDLQDPQPLDVFWCAAPAPVCEVFGTLRPFYYTRYWPRMEAVVDWARQDGEEIFHNAKRVQAIVSDNDSPVAANRLLSYTLHNWLANTWWLDGEGDGWFSVWEGLCGYHGTVDVEFTQAPFYLAVWPELLLLQLREWTSFFRDGQEIVGPAGTGSLYLSHDMGMYCRIGEQIYPHDMAYEETANFLLLLDACASRTGHLQIVEEQEKIVRSLCLFLEKCATTGDGLPDLGVANTIDDASPAVQYGTGQVYLGVKGHLAFLAAARLLAKDGPMAEKYLAQARRMAATIEEKAWRGDHYAVLCRPGGRLTDPWTGRSYEVEELPGWDAAHIYTANAMAVARMSGLTGFLSEERLEQDLSSSTRRCLQEYGCVHSDYGNTTVTADALQEGLRGASVNPGWISMNILRDLVAYRLGLPGGNLLERYWEWQVMNNQMGRCKLFFETFGGNHLCYYPRGVAIWGIFEAQTDLAIDMRQKLFSFRTSGREIGAPFLLQADWEKGVCSPIGKNIKPTQTP